MISTESNPLPEVQAKVQPATSALLEALERGTFTREVALELLPLVDRVSRTPVLVDADSVESISVPQLFAVHAERLRKALDPIEATATACMLATAENSPCCSGEEPPEPTPEQLERAEEILLREALYPFHARTELREILHRNLP